MTVIQRFGGGLNLNVHFHTLVLDGVFIEGAGAPLRFRPLPPPTDKEIGIVLAMIDTRVRRLLQRRGFDTSGADLPQRDPVAEESPALAGISSASIQGRIALGRRAGARVWRVGEEPDAPWVLLGGPRHAHIAGFDLHANVAVPAADRARLEQLCRYLLRPAVAQDRLRLMGDGRVLLTLKTAWADGTRHLMFEPLEFLEKLAAIRVRRARHHASSFDEVSATVDEDPPSVHDWSAKVEDPALQVELRRVLTVALDTLPEDHRAIVVLRDVEGLSPEEVSQITGLSIPAVKTRTHRARLVLRKWLGEYFSDRPMSLPASPAASSSSPRRQRSSASKRAGRRSGRAKALLA